MLYIIWTPDRPWNTFFINENYFRNQGVKNNSIIRKTQKSQISEEMKNGVIQSVNLFF